MIEIFNSLRSDIILATSQGGYGRHPKNKFDTHPETRGIGGI